MDPTAVYVAGGGSNKDAEEYVKCSDGHFPLKDKKGRIVSATWFTNAPMHPRAPRPTVLRSGRQLGAKAANAKWEPVYTQAEHLRPVQLAFVANRNIRKGEEVVVEYWAWKST